MNISTDETIYCIGCGASIQTDDKQLEGYVPQSALENWHEEDALYCQRCFRLRHYNDPQNIALDKEAYLAILNEISQQDALVVMVVDLFDFNGSFISGIQRFKGNNPLLIAANKVDILPKTVKQNQLKNWVSRAVSKFGAQADEVVLTSALDETSVINLLGKIEAMRDGRDVYIVGTTNVGKSTLVNKMINLSIDEQSLITTSYFPGTTLGKIEVPLADGARLIDTPGIIQDHQLSYYVENEDLKQLQAGKRMRPKVYQLNPGQTLFLAGLGRIDYIAGKNKASFVVYVSNNLYIHRTKTENAETAYQSLVGNRLTPPQSADNTLPEFSAHEFRTKEASDIAISGLGWVAVPEGVTVSAYAPNGVNVYLRQAMI